MTVIPGLAFLVASLQVGTTSSQQPLTVLRIVAGPHGEVRNGTFVLDEERAQFDPAKDKEVVVYFQWQGSSGAHRMVAQWKSPDGASSTAPPIDYTAPDRRFGAFWTLPITTASATGTWSVEATVDGQPGGRFNFDLVVGAAGAPVANVRHLPTAGELFARVSAVFVVLERSTSKGTHLDPAAAYMASSGRLFTSVTALDGADAITAVLPDGKRQPITSVIAFNRLQDWAIVSGGSDTAHVVSQPIAAESSVQIGDRVYSLEASAPTSRVLADGQITGRAGSSTSGPRFVTSVGGPEAPPGEPVFNEYGELIGIMGGSLVPGATDLGDLIRFRGELRGSPIVPISLFRSALDAAPTAIVDVRARGDLLLPVEGGMNVASGGFARSMSKSSVPSPIDERRDFSAKEKEFFVFIAWRAQTRVKGLSTLRVYDEGNHVLVDSKPAKVDIRPDNFMWSSWKMPIPERPGVYRADVMIDGIPIWRGFVRISE